MLACARIGAIHFTFIFGRLFTNADLSDSNNDSQAKVVIYCDEVADGGRFVLSARSKRNVDNSTSKNGACPSNYRSSVAASVNCRRM